MPLETKGEAQVRWLHRRSGEAGTTALLMEAVAGLDGPPGETTYVWDGGESRAMTAVRKHVKRRWRIPREFLALTPYWRHPTGVAG